MCRAYTTQAGFFACLFWLTLLPFGTVAAAALELQANPADSTDGTVRLTWSPSAGALVHVQRDNRYAFTNPVPVYRGSDSASVITGLADGEYFFRARSESVDGHQGVWSDPVRVSVRHHPLGRAFGFFALGAVVFLATLLLIVTAARPKGGSA